MSAAFLLIESVSRLVALYGFLLILYILSSWIPQLRHSRVGEILAQVSEPYLRLFRGIIPLLGGIDFSPILAFIVLRLVQGILNQAQGAL
ncbi:MAG: YggT family protein [Synechococcus sp. SB0668_bin_15]|nr:YggT family protein [Synechococcus sp. SB0668_bin_15]MXZ83475.1 YggT family protein [Synechococcus sp. SB0666_bin_14]MYA91009.1 YggT family protein [Synechococcus sp. SB0663_bin_10]MYC49243.1 YggT family protein [Synechococcus sp. SB0662_bin_14]MYG47227.1 YggT family protein [Synechococcus sp. SB0675_bin_6]MYJ60589.1 YggT family protein [Synechococcus sp. SB0672_bin_6]MYK91933.1 YggT family protein [Synechococcus sp. SB0669_bin_8]